MNRRRGRARSCRRRSRAKHRHTRSHNGQPNTHRLVRAMPEHTAVPSPLLAFHRTAGAAALFAARPRAAKSKADCPAAPTPSPRRSLLRCRALRRSLLLLSLKTRGRMGESEHAELRNPAGTAAAALRPPPSPSLLTSFVVVVLFAAVMPAVLACAAAVAAARSTAAACRQLADAAWRCLRPAAAWSVGGGLSQTALSAALDAVAAALRMAAAARKTCEAMVRLVGSGGRVSGKKTEGEGKVGGRAPFCNSQRDFVLQSPEHVSAPR
eukprot:358738-Chlamydomonas_euryale.AAC.6